MATRFYLPSTPLAPRRPTVSASWGVSNGVTTTIAAGSNLVSLPTASINVANAANFSTSGGTIIVQTDAGSQVVSYTGITGNQFTGCSGGTGTMRTGNSVIGPFSTRRMSTVKQNTPMTNWTATKTTASNPQNLGIMQYISDPLKAQTISGTVDGYIQCSESALTNDANAQIIIRVLESDYTTVRGTLLAADAGAAVSNEFATTLTNRAFPVGLINNTLSSVTVQDYDILVVEIGAKYFTANTSIFHTMRLGDNTGLSDLNPNETDTADGVPWIEFSQNLLFATASERSNFQTASGSSSLGNQKGANSRPSITQVDGVGFLPIGGGYSYSKFQSASKDGYEHVVTHKYGDNQFGSPLYFSNLVQTGKTIYYKMVGFYATGSTYESFVSVNTPAASTVVNPNTGHTLTNTYVAAFWIV